MNAPSPSLEPGQPSPEQSADLAALERAAGEQQPQAPAQPEAPVIPTAQLVAPVVALICARFVPLWQITPAEQQQLAEAYGAVVDKYFPGGIRAGPELTALIVTAAVFGPRLGTPARLEDLPKDEGQPKGQGEGQPSPAPAA